MHKKALALHSELNDIKREIPNLSFIGINYVFLGEMKRGDKYLNMALGKSIEENYLEGIADSKYFLAISKMIGQEYLLSTLNAIISAQICWGNNDIYKFLQALKLLSNIYKKRGRKELVTRVDLIYNAVHNLFTEKA